MRYRPVPGGRATTAFLFVPFAIVSMVLIAMTIARADSAPPLAFTVFWLAGVGWNAYWWLFRIAYELVLDHDRLTVRYTFRERTIQLHEINAIRPMRAGQNVIIFEVRGQRPIITMAIKGFGEFTQEIQRRRPDLPIRLNRWSKISEALPGRSGVD